MEVRGALRGLRGWQYVSRKFLRWLTLIPLVLLLIGSAALAGQRFFALVLTLELIFYGLTTMGWVLALNGRVPSRLQTGRVPPFADTCHLPPGLGKV